MERIIEEDTEEGAKEEGTKKTDSGLDWELWISKAVELAQTEAAKTRLNGLLNTDTWATSVETAENLQSETWEVLPLTSETSGKTFLWTSLAGLHDPEPSLNQLEHGGLLWIEELVELRRWLETSELWLSVPKDEFKGERFRKAVQCLMSVAAPLAWINRVLGPDGTLLDNASPKLQEISSEIRRIKKDIGTTLDSLLKNYGAQGLLQETYSDMRDGRFVLPVRVSSQSQVQGQIYGTSVSQQTVFIEPAEISPLNHRLQAKQAEHLQEVYRILQELTVKLRSQVAAFQNNCQILIHWDVVQARAKLGLTMGAKPIRIAREETRFSIYNTANPLLWHTIPKDSIIRNDIHFGSPHQTLLISGPNTGGKTVLLKTIGLAAAFARTGFLFPASEVPTVPFFNSIFSDLGDAQSLEHQTSSFSGHLLKFRRMIDAVQAEKNGNCLVLLDELNTATDPEEGAALGRALLEWLMQRDVMVVTTTHDPRLKLLASENTKILNASMAFSETSRQPTFQIQMGLPGRSRALDTAERFGLPHELVSTARSYLSSEHNRIEDTLKKIEEQSSTLEELRREATQARLEATRLKDDWTKRMETGMGDLLTRTRQKLRQLLDQAQDEVRRSVRKLDEARSRKDIDRARQEIGQDFNALLQRTETILEEESPETAALLKNKAEEAQATSQDTNWKTVGAWVRIPKWKNVGQILDINSGKIRVSMGSLQVQLAESDIFRLNEAEIRTLQSQRLIPSSFQFGNSAGFSESSSSKATSSAVHEPELDIRGMRYEEAMTALGLYLDRTYRSGNYQEVTIIHGLGTGALREGTRLTLKKLPYIKSVRDGGAHGGGAGATFVEFTV